jgi:hypothetical protein
MVCRWDDTKEVFLNSTASMPALGPTHPMGTMGSFTKGKAARASQLTIHLRIVQRSRMVELFLHFPIRLNGVVLNLLYLIYTFSGPQRRPKSRSCCTQHILGIQR